MSRVKSKLDRLWAIGNPPGSLKLLLSTNKKECESCLVNNMKSDKSGRFVVQIQSSNRHQLLETQVYCKKAILVIWEKVTKLNNVSTNVGNICPLADEKQVCQEKWWQNLVSIKTYVMFWLIQLLVIIQKQKSVSSKILSLRI